VICGRGPVHAHHPDYSQPLDVVFLCQRHHSQLHARLRKRYNELKPRYYTRAFHDRVLEEFMSVTTEQCQRVARVLYPELWETNRIEAVAKTIEFLHETASEVSDGNSEPVSSNAQAGRRAPLIKSLAEHMQRRGIHVNVVARAIGVSPYTVRTWLEGKYTPNEQNSRKLEDFIETPPLDERQSQGSPNSPIYERNVREYPSNADAPTSPHQPFKA
jgi:hypothetical protein